MRKRLKPGVLSSARERNAGYAVYIYNEYVFENGMANTENAFTTSDYFTIYSIIFKRMTSFLVHYHYYKIYETWHTCVNRIVSNFIHSWFPYMMPCECMYKRKVARLALLGITMVEFEKELGGNNDDARLFTGQFINQTYKSQKDIHI